MLTETHAQPQSDFAKAKARPRSHNTDAPALASHDVHSSSCPFPQSSPPRPMAKWRRRPEGQQRRDLDLRRCNKMHVKTHTCATAKEQGLTGCLLRGSRTTLAMASRSQSNCDREFAMCKARARKACKPPERPPATTTSACTHGHHEHNCKGGTCVQHAELKPPHVMGTADFGCLREQYAGAQAPLTTQFVF